MEPLKLSGLQLKTQMIRNNKSLKESAKALGITIEELQYYFEYEVIERDMLFDLLSKLKIWLIIEDPYRITSLAFDQFGIYESRIKLLESMLKDNLDFVNLIEKATDENYNVVKAMSKCLQEFYEMLKREKPGFEKENVFNVNKMNEELKKNNDLLKNIYDSFNERFKEFKK